MRDPRTLANRFRGATPVVPGIRASLLAPSEIVDGVATLRLYDPIDSWGGEWGVSAKEVATALDGLSPSTTEIRLHLNSPGGEVYEGIAMLNTLRAHPARVVAVVDGIAASAASFLAAGADELVMGRNSQLMIHDAWGLAMGNAGTMRETADVLDKISDNIASVYAAKAGGDVGTWRAAMLLESWYSAEEAVDAGLADRVEEALAPAGPLAAFDLSIFDHAGREAAPTPLAPVRPTHDAWATEKLRERHARTGAALGV